MMVALRDAFQVKQNLDAGLMIVSDEEIGGFDGVNKLLGQEGYRSQFAIVGEGNPEAQIVHRQKGICQLKITVKGDSAHAAYPWLGKNAADLLLNDIAYLKKEFPKPRDAWISTFTLSKINIPDGSLNKSPDYAEALCDVRFTEAFALTPQGVISKFSARIPNASFELLLGGSMLNTDNHNKFVRDLRILTKSTYGEILPLGFSHGSSDGRFFGERAIPCVEFGPNGGGHHSENEYVEVQSMKKFYATLKKFLLAP